MGKNIFRPLFSHSQLTALAVVAMLVLAGVVSACARIGSPDGGPYDETPPRIVRTSPKFGSAKEKSVKKVVIEFDEIVKIDNASDNVVISPPQIEQPEIEADGRKVTVQLRDTLKPNMTYTIDFADAIVDNNEGNPFGNYAFTFSTGETVDTLQVSGNVLDASNLEPVKGILVGLYRVGGEDDADSVSVLPDSVFRTKPFERISRTDGSGRFIVKGLAPGKYRVYALKDQNQNYIYDQKAEMVAFAERIVSPYSKPDIRPDTVWHDSIHYDSIVMTPYTHFYPDDIVLSAFLSDVQDRYMLKSERPTLQQFSILFTAPSDTLPLLTGLNFDASDAFVIDANERKDTLNYWIKDSLIYNLDTLEIKIDFYATDTTGNLSLTVDTLRLVPKLTKAKLAKQRQEAYDEWVKECKQRAKEERRAAKKAADEGEDDKHDEGVVDRTLADAQTDAREQSGSDEAEKSGTEDSVAKGNDNKGKKKSKRTKKNADDDIVIPPMPEEFINYRVYNASGMDPDKNIDFVFEEPLDSFDLSKIHFSIRRDSLYVPARYKFRQVPGDIMRYRLYAEWEPDSVYSIEIDTAAFVNIYGKRCEAKKVGVTMKKMESYSTLFVVLAGTDSSAIVQLLNSSDKPVKTIKARDGKADFYFITPGVYYLRMFCDRNGNGKWDTGDYDKHLQPEEMYYYPEALTLKAQWEITQEWNPTALPLAKQKPMKITKQKPDKERKVKNRNADRNK